MNKLNNYQFCHLFMINFYQYLQCLIKQIIETCFKIIFYNTAKNMRSYQKFLDFQQLKILKLKNFNLYLVFFIK